MVETRQIKIKKKMEVNLPVCVQLVREPYQTVQKAAGSRN